MVIGVEDIRTHYVTIAEARSMSGLRIVLGAFPIPGPWHEACKGVFYAKGLGYVPVRSSNEGESDLAVGMNNSQSELVECCEWLMQWIMLVLEAALTNTNVKRYVQKK